MSNQLLRIYDFIERLIYCRFVLKHLSWLLGANDFGGYKMQVSSKEVRYNLFGVQQFFNLPNEKLMILFISGD
ncbi:MAG: hypothetical protein KKA84_10705 [Bacteroidetes bacterium]|nr:hypothetical protein [Bacteroidota bacterium]